MHKKIIEKSLSRLDPDRATYFGAVVGKLEKDPRIENNANLVFSVLKDVMTELPIYLQEDELIEQLLSFTEENYQALRIALYNPKFVHDPASFRSVTGAFINQIASLALRKLKDGEIGESSLSVQTYTWPYRETDISDPEDDPEEWAEAVAKSEKWRQENNGVDRRQRGTARIDEIGLGKKKKP